jgi:uncharacterized repeat protein (TIGR01451 family)
VPGDILQYQITVANTGNDASTATMVKDALPAGATYVPGSVTIAAASATDATLVAFLACVALHAAQGGGQAS